MADSMPDKNRAQPFFVGYNHQYTRGGRFLIRQPVVGGVAAGKEGHSMADGIYPVVFPGICGIQAKLQRSVDVRFPFGGLAYYAI